MVDDLPAISAHAFDLLDIRDFNFGFRVFKKTIESLKEQILKRKLKGHLGTRENFVLERETKFFRRGIYVAT